jgi:hypothetical protein
MSMQALKLLREEKRRQRQEQQAEEAIPTPTLASPLVFDLQRPFGTPIHPSGGLEGVMLFPDFVSFEEEAHLLRHLEQSPWLALRNRRLQCFGGDPEAHAVRSALPEWLSALLSFQSKRFNLNSHEFPDVRSFKPCCVF